VSEDKEHVVIAEVPAGSELPRVGHGVGGSLRTGGWFLYGHTCDSGDPRCTVPERFRFCTTRRDGWVLELVCLDGLAQPVCRGTISE
jgi:hypothetical protein